MTNKHVALDWRCDEKKKKKTKTKLELTKQTTVTSQCWFKPKQTRATNNQIATEKHPTHVFVASISPSRLKVFSSSFPSHEHTQIWWKTWRFSSKANVRIRKTPRTCYLPHQHVNYHVRPLPGIVKRSSLTSGNLLNGPSNESHDLFTNLLKTNFLDSVKSSVPLDQKQQLAAANTHLTQNFVLSDQSSRSIPAIAAAVASRRIVDCSPAGLTAAALTINLSSLGPLYASVRAKDPNSSNRVSRAASPLGNSAENNRLTNWMRKKNPQKKKNAFSCLFWLLFI